MPKINLIYYKNILDMCVRRFFAEHNCMFRKSEEGRFVYSGTVSATKLRDIFREYVVSTLREVMTRTEHSQFQYFFVLGGCFPGENVLLDTLKTGVAGNSYFPVKFSKLVDVLPDIKYFLVERDIDMDMRTLNSAFDSIFHEFFTKRQKSVKKYFGNEFEGKLFFIKHRNLDCYLIFKLIKQKYGSMCVNLHKAMEMGEDTCIWSVNDKIDQYSHSKLEFLNGPKMAAYKKEVWKFLEDCINGKE